MSPLSHSSAGVGQGPQTPALPHAPIPLDILSIGLVQNTGLVRAMRPKTKVPIPEPKGSEFENFDRLTGILVQVKRPLKKQPKKKAAAKK
jgi:hypothetical protein